MQMFRNISHLFLKIRSFWHFQSLLLGVKIVKKGVLFFILLLFWHALRPRACVYEIFFVSLRREMKNILNQFKYFNN